MKWLMTSTPSGKTDQTYLDWLALSGIEAERISHTKPLPGNLDGFGGLFLTGGGDVDPELYGAARAPETENINLKRDRIECALIHLFVRCGKPVFGICRGIQIVNVAFGGKLIQHVPAVVKGLEQHEQAHGKDAVHPVSFLRGTRLAEILGDVHEVNSAHHQAVDPSAIGKNLRPSAISGQGIIEAIEGDGMPVFAVQWHPERLRPATCPASAELLKLMRRLAAG